MAKKNRKGKRSAPKHSAPKELTEEEVRAARKGKGTHKLPGKQGGYSPVEPASEALPS